MVPVQRVALAVAVAWEGHAGHGQGGQGGQGAAGAGHPHSFNSSGISGSFRGSHGHGHSDGNVSAHSDPKSPSPNNDIWISEVLVLNEQNQSDLSDLSDLDHNTSQKRSLGLKLQNTKVTSESLESQSDQKALTANLALNALQGSDPAFSERKLRTAAKTVSILQEPELPKNEFTTSVQMHVQADESMKETAGDFVPSVEPRQEAKDSTSEMELNVQKTFSYGTYGEKSVTSVNIVMKNRPIADEDPEMPNASKAFRSDPMTAFLSPSSSWPKRSDLDTSLKTCFAALLAAVILALKINKIFSFQCCKSFRANDWESYDYDQLPQLPQLPIAESWWERSEREEERNDRNDERERETFRPTEKRETTPERERNASAASNPGADFRSTISTSQTSETSASETQRLRSQELNLFCSDCYIAAHSRHRLSIDYHRFMDAQI